jgi:hypothetical protein
MVHAADKSTLFQEFFAIVKKQKKKKRGFSPSCYASPYFAQRDAKSRLKT